MVQLMGSFQEDFTEEKYAPLTKRSRLNLNQGRNRELVSPGMFNLLDEPSPLGLRLRKSPSLLELIQMRLSKESSSASVSVASGEVVDSGSKTNTKGVSASVTNDKLKASNFPASLLRIGSWEYVSKYEGDLVAKCYFAKHKLVWEVLKGGLKSKIEIQWSNITALKADCPNDGPGSLSIVLARKPAFFRETNPQPRKHTLWQATTDFTNGQARINKKHFIQCPPGVLNKHYEKLIQCDMRLSILSRQLEIVMDSPYFESKAPTDENQDESKGDAMSASVKGSYSIIDDASSSAVSMQLSPGSSVQNLVAAQLVVKKEALSPSSVMDTHAIEGNKIPDDERNSEVQKSGERLAIPRLLPSKSITDLVNCISEQITSGSFSSAKVSECQDMLDNIAQVLLTDTQSSTTGLDEKSLLKKVDSLCCLLQEPVTASTSQVDAENIAQVLLSDAQPATCLDEKSLMKKVNSLRCLLQDPSVGSGTQTGENRNESDDRGKNVSFSLGSDYTHEKVGDAMKGSEGNLMSGSGSEVTSGMQRKDSLSDLLLHLPSIASLPKFLFGITEDDEFGSM